MCSKALAQNENSYNETNKLGMRWGGCRACGSQLGPAWGQNHAWPWLPRLHSTLWERCSHLGERPDLHLQLTSPLGKALGSTGIWAISPPSLPQFPATAASPWPRVLRLDTKDQLARAASKTSIQTSVILLFKYEVFCLDLGFVVACFITYMVQFIST